MRELDHSRGYKTTSFTEDDVLVQILAGGKGIGLLSETKGQIPKSLVKVSGDKTILDVVIEKTKEQGFGRIIYSLGLSDGCFGADIYKHILEKKHGVECVFEYYGGGNARTIQKLAKLTDCKYPLLVLCSDMLLPWDAMRKAVLDHKPGTMTWVTSSVKRKEMERYFGLKVRRDGAVVYDTKLTPEGNFLDDGNLRTVTKGGAIVIDPKLLIKTMDQLTKTKNMNKQIDIYWDVIPFLEKLNWERLKDGKSSLLYAVIGDDPIMDMGTPERLSSVRKYLDHEK